jgi:hypothetical protein
LVIVGVSVGVGVIVAVGVLVGSGVLVGLGVGVSVKVLVGIGVGLAWPLAVSWRIDTRSAQRRPVESSERSMRQDATSRAGLDVTRFLRLIPTLLLLHGHRDLRAPRTRGREASMYCGLASSECNLMSIGLSRKPAPHELPAPDRVRATETSER